MRPWRRPAPVEPARTGPRIAVLGNCQARGIAEVLRLLLPTTRVEPIYLAHLARRFRTMDRLIAELERYDHVFAHVFGETFLPGGSAYVLDRRLKRCRLVPTITFAAFHPDMVLVGDVEALAVSKLAPSPVGRSHSAIALSGYLEGLSAEATVALFTDSVFERLGYYGLWDESVAFLLRGGREVGFDLRADMTRWSRRGCFMHDVNHPKLHVLADLARRLAVEAGLQPLDVAVEDYLPDRQLEEAAWPVYPAIAERYGLPPASLFRKPGPGNEPPCLLDLRRFVGDSFALYARSRREALRCERVEAWRADPAVRAVFASAGRA